MERVRLDKTNCSSMFWSRGSCSRENQCNSEINTWLLCMIFDDGTSLVLSLQFFLILLLVWCVAVVNPVMGFRHFHRIFQIAGAKYLVSLVKICMMRLWIALDRPGYDKKTLKTCPKRRTHDRCSIIPGSTTIESTRTVYRCWLKKVNSSLALR